MRKKLVFAGLLISCISFFSFREVCNDNEDTCVKQVLPGTIMPISREKEEDNWSFSPVYNLLKI